MMQVIPDWIGLRSTVLPSVDFFAQFADQPSDCFVNVYRGDHCEIAYGCAVAFSRKGANNFAGWGKNKPLYRIRVRHNP